MVYFHVKLPEKTFYSKIITARAAVFDLLGVKVRANIFFGLGMDFFHVKLPEKTMYAKIITARAAVLYLHWVKDQGQKKIWQLRALCHNLLELFDMRMFGA